MSTALEREPRPGDPIGPYEIVGRIAQGGMGSIHAARRRAASGFEKLLAVKVLHPQLGAERRFVDMFLDEARIAARVEHPNVVSTLDVIEHEGVPVIVMELLRGRSLAALLAKGPVPQAALFAILASAAEGLAAAHEAVGADGQLLELVHRDVSPHNIHVGYEGQVKLIDFGVAAARGKISSTRTGEVKGKLAYLAPEQIMQGSVDHRTDLFALGVVAWEALSGQRLFRQDEEGATLWAVMHKPVPALGSVVRELPSEVENIVTACLARSIDDRPSSAREVASVFARAAAGRAPGARSGAAIADAMAKLDRERSEDDALLSGLTRNLGQAAPRSVVGAELRETESTSTMATGSVLAVEPVKRVRRSTVLLPVAAVVVAAALGALALRAQKPSAPATSTATATGTALPVLEAITIGVAPEVRLVLVDGARVDARPLTLELPAGKSARVSLVGFDGRIEERVISRESAGDTLGLSASPEMLGATTAASSPPAGSAPQGVASPTGLRPRQVATGAAPASAQPSAPRSPLLRSPY